MGFSLIGSIMVTVILVPNFLLLAFPPRDIPEIKAPGIIYSLTERIGQICCIFLLIVSEIKFETTPINIWFILMTICTVIYYGLWIRFYVHGRSFLVLFKSLGVIPIPMAIFPVLAFGFAAIWGKSIWIGISVILLAIGHFTVSWNTYKYMKAIK